MTLLEVLALAILQGLTEFLPVSSSGHLVLASTLFETPLESSFTLIVVIHMATACAALAYYRRDVTSIIHGLLAGREDARRTLLLIAVASLATAAIGLNFRHAFRGLFQNPQTVAPSLFVTGAVLLAASRLPPGGERLEKLALWKALLIGLAQGLAIVPGISRSGMTIAAGLLLKLRREDAVKFSFLILVPATAGAALLEAFRVASLEGGLLLQSVAGFLVAALVGYASIFVVLRWTGRGRLWHFGLYCWGAALFAAISGRLG